jgi:hypothetical protein
MIVRTIILLMLTASAGFSQAVDYKVSTAGKDREKLEAVYQAVAALEVPAMAGQDFETIFKVSPTEYVVWKRVLVQNPVYHNRLSIIGGGPAPLVTYSKQTKTDVSYLIKLRKPVERADGELIEGIVTRVTGETRTIGVGTHRVLEEIEPEAAPQFTKEEFVRLLKSGKTWTLPRFETHSCHRCLGDGKLSKMEKEAKCPDCAGKGGTKTDLVVGW